MHLSLPKTVVHRLKEDGLSEAAAKRLMERVSEGRDKANINFHGRDYRKVEADIARFNKKMHNKLLRECPADLAVLQLKTPVKAIVYELGNYQQKQAVETYADLRIGFDRNLYLLTPVDYVNQYTQPVDSELVPDDIAHAALYQRNGETYDASPRILPLIPRPAGLPDGVDLIDYKKPPTRHDAISPLIDNPRP